MKTYNFLCRMHSLSKTRLWIKYFPVLLLLLALATPSSLYAAAFNDTFDTDPPTGTWTTSTFTKTYGVDDINYTFSVSGTSENLQISRDTQYGEGDSGSLVLQSLSEDTNSTETLTIKRQDGQDFKFTSIWVGNDNSQSSSSVTVTPYNDGTPGTSQTANQNDFATLDFTGINVDEIRITSVDFYQINIDSFIGDTDPIVVNAPPTVTTQAVSSITKTTATGNGNITDLGSPDPTAHGVVWNLSGTPTTTNSIDDKGATSATGAFTANMTGLSPATTYYVRAFATNSQGTAYGNEVSFTTATDSNGSLTAAGGVTEPVGLSSAIDLADEAIDIFDFTISDGGGGDALSLDVTQIVLHTSGTAPFSKVSFRLNGLGSNVAGTYDNDANTLTFSGLSISVADGASETYTVNAYYDDNTDLTEGWTYILFVDGDTDLTVSAGGSGFGSTSPVTNGTGSVVDITATQLVFETQPSAGPLATGSNMGPVTLKALDAGGNVDTDFTETVTLTDELQGGETDGPGSLSTTDGGNSLAVSASGGQVTWANLSYNAAATINVQATSTSFATESSDITVYAVVTHMVDISSDENDGGCVSGDCSLREAILNANDGDSIDLSALVGTLTLDLGELDISKDLTIIGPTVNSLTISGNSLSRVFNIAAGKTVNIANLTISNGSVNSSGGGILNAGDLTLNKVTLSGNSTSAGGNGGAISNTGTGTLSVTNSTISGNMAAGSGGALDNSGSFTLNNVTIYNNTAAAGNAINASASGSIRNSIVAVGCSGVTHTSLGNNIETDTTCGLNGSGDLQNTDPLLDPLADNGGTTFTHALKSGSPAIDAGNNATDESTDQRSVNRPRDGNNNGSAVSDIGAYEHSPGTLRFSASAYSTGEGNESFTVTVTRTGGSDGTASVNYATSDGTATLADNDYTEAAGTLNWTHGETASKTFTVTITDDSKVESHETVRLTLGNFTGALTGSPSSATLTITNNDTASTGGGGTTPSGDDTTPPADGDDQQTIPDIAEDITDGLGNVDLPADPNEPITEEHEDAVDDLVNKTVDILNLAESIQKTGTLSSSDAVAVLEVVDNMVDTVAQLSGAGGNVDVGTVTEAIGLVDDVVEEMISGAQPVTDDQLDNIVEISDRVLESLPEIIGTAPRSEGRKLVKEMGNLVDAGLAAGLSAGETNVDAVSNMLDNISSVIAALALDTTITGNTDLADSAARIIGNIINRVIKTGNAKGTLSPVTNQLLKETSQIIESIRNNITLNPIPFSDFEGGDVVTRSLQGRNSASDVTSEKIARLMKEVAALVEPFLGGDIPLEEQVMGSISTLTRDATDSVIDVIAGSLPNYGNTPLSGDKQAIAVALKENPGLLDALLEVCSVDLTPILLEPGAQELNRMPDIFDPERGIFAAGDMATPMDVLMKGLSAVVPFATLNVDSFTGTITVTPPFTGGLEEHPVLINGVQMASDSIPDGFLPLPDGRITVAKDGLVVTIAPFVGNGITNFNELVSGEEEWQNNDFLWSFSAEGTWALAPGNNTVISGAFSWTAEKNPADSETAPNHAELLGDDPAQEAYTARITFSDGTRRRMPPFIFSRDIFGRLLKAMGIEYVMDFNTGVITTSRGRFKPDYYVSPLTGDDLAHLIGNSYPGVPGVSWRTGDFNGDSLEEFELLTYDGVQKFYSLKP